MGTFWGSGCNTFTWLAVGRTAQYLNVVLRRDFWWFHCACELHFLMNTKTSLIAISHSVHHLKEYLDVHYINGLPAALE